MATIGAVAEPGTDEPGEFLAERLRKARALSPSQGQVLQERGAHACSRIAPQREPLVAQVNAARSGIIDLRAVLKLQVDSALMTCSPADELTNSPARSVMDLVSALHNGTCVPRETCRAWDAELPALDGRLLGERQPNDPCSLRFERDCVTTEVFCSAPNAAIAAAAPMRRGLALAERPCSNFWQASFAYILLSLTRELPDPSRVVATPAEAARLFCVAYAAYAAAKALPLRWLVVLRAERAAADTVRQFVARHEREGLATWSAIWIPHSTALMHKTVAPPKEFCAGNECQLAQWPGHKKECKAARRAAASGGAPDSSSDV
eukprot:scaffold11.g3894.t1